MLKTAFIGSRNSFDLFICEWLAEHTDLSLIVWTNDMAWSGSTSDGRKKRIIERFKKRASRFGVLQAANEIAYYAIYRAFLAAEESRKVSRLVHSSKADRTAPLESIPQIMPKSFAAAEVKVAMRETELDALFAMCIDVKLPTEIIGTPRLGSYLWHEGITPEYRGVYAPFWALVRKDYKRLGYTLLKMNMRFDAGDIYVQGQVGDIDPMMDWHSYIGHKAIRDSLPDTAIFLKELEAGCAKPIERSDAVDGFYSYPTATALIRIFGHRLVSKVHNARVGNKS